MVSSSHSTDETIVADSDVEIDTATSNIVAANKTSNVVADTAKSQDAIKYEDQEAKKPEDIKDPTKHQESNKSTDYLNTSSDKIKASCPEDNVVASMRKLDKGNEPFADQHENSDIIFSQDLIVRDIITPVPVQSTSNNVANFKCFRKVLTCKHYLSQSIRIICL